MLSLDSLRTAPISAALIALSAFQVWTWTALIVAWVEVISQIHYIEKFSPPDTNQHSESAGGRAVSPAQIRSIHQELLLHC